MTARWVGRLPDDLTSFVGRRGAITQVKRLLSASRLVTLTGVAGVGKSRLATRVARDLRRAFPDGVWLVELGRLTPHSDIARVVLAGLGFRDRTSLPPVDLLTEHLTGKRLLVVLDDCEHLLDECGPLVGEMLAAAPEVRILVTSRAPLAIAGEQVWPVPPMAMPVLEHGRVLHKSTGYEVLELFADRASAVLPGFTIGPDNEAPVVRVCRQLDGLPLAIELAAVWMRSLSVEEILDRLADRNRLLTLGDRSADPRHRTLRAAIEWSFDLCSPIERTLWARLSVFAGSFDLDAAEAVCAGDGVAAEDVFAGIAGLVEKSVLIREEHGSRTRYRLLRTIRVFGREQLDDASELVLGRRHRDHFLRLAERFDSEWLGPRQVEWLHRLREDRANLNTALDFCRAEPGEAAEGLRLAAALRFFWIADPALRQGRYWLDEMLRAAPEVGAQRARALVVNGLVRGLQAESGPARVQLAEARAQARRSAYGELPALIPHVAGTIDLLREEYASAAQHFTDAVERGDTRSGAALLSLPYLALLKVFRGDWEDAAELCERCRAGCEKRGELWVRAWSEMVLGLARWRMGNAPGALAGIREGLRIKRVFNDVNGILLAIEMESWVAVTQGRASRAVRLSAAVAHLWQPRGNHLYGIDRFLGWHGETEARARSTLSPADFHEAWRKGEECTLDQLIRFTVGGRAPPPTPDTRLTPREREVAKLVARGLSNRQIAEQLVISKRTADSHIEHILAKLGVASRAQIAVWFVEQP